MKVMAGCQALEALMQTGLPAVLKKVIGVCALLTIPLALQTNCAATASGVAKQTFKITQSSYFVGRTDAYLSKSAIRINLGTAKVFLVAAAPNWRVTLFNEEHKTGLSFSYAEWLSRHPAWSNSLDHDWIPRAPLLASGTGKAFGMPTRTYSFAKRQNGGLTARFKGQKASITYADNKLVAEEACHILQRTLGVQQMEGIPLELTFFSAERKVEGMSRALGGMQKMVRTLAFVPSNDKISYASPKQFKVASSEAELMNTDERDEVVKDFVENLR